MYIIDTNECISNPILYIIRNGDLMNLMKVSDIDEAQNVLYDCIKNISGSTLRVNTADSLNKIIAEDLYATENVPSFRRSTVDGYAVVSSDVSVASESIPVFLKVKDEVKMGKPAVVEISRGECVYVPTGGAVPEGADAMVMIEYTEKLGENRISVFQSAAKGTDIVNIGEDVKEGQPLIKKGTAVTPQIIGVLCAAGFDKINIFSPLKIAVISTGNELISPQEKATPGKIRNVNTYSISAQAEKIGYEVFATRVISDDKEKIMSSVNELKSKADIICISGGSSKGKKDFTAQIIDESGDPGTLIHGLSVKPGKPTIIGYDSNTETIMAGLPGHPVSSFMIFELLFGNLFRKYTNSESPNPYFAKMSQNLAGSPGKTTCIPVKLIRHETEYIAQPAFGKSGLISTLSNADGYIVIDKNDEGINKGEAVTVYTI